MGGAHSAVIGGKFPQYADVPLDADADAGEDVYRCGTAVVDITPPPGFPMAGYSVIGKVSSGYWTRLKCRAITAESARTGHGIALATIDLIAVPGGLVDRVASEVAKRTAGRLAPSQILLSAIHSHNAPGNYFSNDYFNDHFAVRPGFDPLLFAFLAARISDAIVSAFESRVPARLHCGCTRVESIAVNRSLPPFLKDGEAEEWIARDSDLPEYPDQRYPKRAYHAINPVLTVVGMHKIEAEGEAASPFAVAAFFAVHPTAMGDRTDVYSSDFFGVACKLAERELNAGADGGGAVVTLFQGAEGDVASVTLSPENMRRETALELGTKLSAGILRVLHSENPASASDGGGITVDATYADNVLTGPVEYSGTLVPIRGQRFTALDGSTRETSDTPFPGTAAFGGAEEGRTPLAYLGWAEGTTKPLDGFHAPSESAEDPMDSGATEFEFPRQGAKEFPLLPSWCSCCHHCCAPCCSCIMRDPTIMGGTPPAEFLLSVFRIGSLAIASLPSECTTMVGHRSLSTVLERLKPRGVSHVVGVGLSYEYLSYIATAEEYRLQHYEGASTIYGPATADLLSVRLSELADKAFAPGDQANFGRTDYLYEHVGDIHHYAAKDIPYVTPALENVLPVEKDGLYVTFEWTEPAAATCRGVRTTPTVSAQRKTDVGAWEPLVLDGVAETDEGFNFVTFVRGGCQSDGRHWTTHWILPPGATIGGDGGVSVRLAVVGVHKAQMYGPETKVVLP